MVPRRCHHGSLRRLAVVLLGTALLLGSGQAVAQRPSGTPVTAVHFESLPLSGIVVFGFYQDSRGFMWFASDAGLMRWDGYRVRRYHPVIGPGRVGSLYTTAVGEDPDGGIWMATDNGLFRLDTRTERWTFYAEGAEGPLGLNRRGIRALYVSRAGIPWVATQGLDRLDPRTGRTTHFGSDPADPATIGDDIINQIVEDDEGGLWLATNSGIDRLDQRSGRVVRHDPAPWLGLKGHRLVTTALARGSNGRLWVGTARGLLVFDPKGNRFSLPHGPTGEPIPALRGDIRGIAITSDGRAWVGTDNGLVSFDPSSGRTASFLGVPEGPNRVGAVPLRAVYVDRSDAVWAAPQGQPVSRYDPHGARVRVFRHDPQAREGLAGAVWALTEDARGHVWLGTDGGVDRVDLDAETIQHYPSVPGDATRLQSPLIRDITVDEGGAIWTGSYTGGAARLDPTSGRVRTYLPDPAQPRGLNQSHVRAVYRNHLGLWFGTLDGYLHRYDPTADCIVRVDVPEHPDGPRILVITGAPDGTLWVGTFGRGLIRYDPTGTAKTFLSDPRDPSTLSSNAIWALAVDRDGILWVGTTAGLDALDPRSGRIRHYTPAEGLSGLAVKSIVEASDGALWIATDQGLSRLATDRRTFRTFTIDDGFFTNAFNLKAGLRTRSGLLCFGGPHGLIVFDPTRLATNPTPPPVVLTDLRLGTTVVRPGEPGSPLTYDIDATTALTLAPRDYAFTLEFAALNYRFPSKNRYRYRLDGVDRDWVMTDSSRRFATYTALSPGEYTFRVTGSNNDGVWNETPRELRIVITPPWWRTPLAHGAYALLAVGSLLGLLRIRTMGHRREIVRQRAINEELERRVAERTAQFESANANLAAANKELEAFSYSVSHDLRAPLRAIDGFVRILATEYEAILPPNGVRLLGIVRDAATQMSRLIDDLLAFSRLGRQPLSRQMVDMNELSSRVAAELTRDPAAGTVDLVIGPMPDCSGDRALLRQVWTNLIGNALKFSRSAGHPRIEIGWDAGERGGAYFVRDNGAGFDMAYAGKLFGVFQRLHSAEQYEGTGVGLAIVQRIVHRHGGLVWARGAVGEGATFAFTIGPGEDSPDARTGAGSKT